MKIDYIKATPVSIPTKRACAWSGGSGLGYSRTIVEVKTKNGLIGYEETAGGGSRKIINKTFAKKLLGKDILEHHSIKNLCISNQGDYAALSSSEEHK